MTLHLRGAAPAVLPLNITLSAPLNSHGADPADTYIFLQTCVSVEMVSSMKFISFLDKYATSSPLKGRYISLEMPSVRVELEKRGFVLHEF